MMRNVKKKILGFIRIEAYVFIFLFAMAAL